MSQPTRSPSRGPDPKPVASSREKILETAEALFARVGFAGVGLREVAERVGLSKSSLFHHFPSKVSLWLAVLERVLGKIESRVGGTTVGGGMPLARLERWLDALIDTLAENPTFAPVLLRALFEEDVASAEESRPADEAIGRILGDVRELLEEGIRSGSFRPLSVPHTIQTLIGMTIYHFASGEFGEELLGSEIYSASEVRRRKREVQNFLRSGLRPVHV